MKLLGRRAECEALDGLLTDALAGHSRVTVLRGEAGVGKTALLNGLADSASATGTTVLRAAGAQFEGEISFTGLNQLLFALIDDLGELGADHRDALRVALGFGAGPPPARSSPRTTRRGSRPSSSRTPP